MIKYRNWLFHVYLDKSIDWKILFIGEFIILCYIQYNKCFGLILIIIQSVYTLYTVYYYDVHCNFVYKFGFIGYFILYSTSVVFNFVTTKEHPWTWTCVRPIYRPEALLALPLSNPPTFFATYSLPYHYTAPSSPAPGFQHAWTNKQLFRCLIFAKRADLKTLIIRILKTTFTKMN